MCGITGWIDWEKDLTQQARVLAAMTGILANRGPDAEGCWISPRAALGHRRLAVIDPEGGGQPMSRRSGNRQYIIVYNGELYNTAELRHELAVCGYSFSGHSDTEVLLTAYIEWGPSCLEKLNGIFAFGVWSEEDQSLFLARDRMGVKPLFYAERNKSFLFGSELKALLAHPDIDPVIDKEGLSEIFVLGPARTPGHGVFRGISELRPGCCLIHNRMGTKIRKYWELESRPHEDDLETTTEKVRGLVFDAIKRQLVADVPVCTFLSGGLDSSAITAVAAQHYNEERKGSLHTYSVDFAGNDRFFRASHFQPNSDADWVHKVSGFFGTDHHYVCFDTPQMAESLKEAVVARDLPGMADIDSSLLLFCREIKKSHTVALSGECADEVFGGYPWYRSTENMDTGSFPWSGHIDTKMQVFSRELVKYIHPEEYMAQRYYETLADTPALPGENPAEADKRKMFYLNFHWFMQTLLDRKDRMSMAVGLEVRVPFCDHRIVEYVWNIPWFMKTCGSMEKGILRRALQGVLPEGVIRRKKSPYPKTHNPSYLAAVRKVLLDILNDPASPLLRVIDIKTVRRMCETENDTFDRPWFGQLMTGPQLLAYLIQVDIWMREYRVRIT
ncbi:MAG: asparagine synthase (glutamine-hydrolyzing) [Firmicutes bacterium HGW-Firmicutes-14]|nr:MAG: asparagine synthase (glutamine-hydrolyzing) [Firmicutes bacterium HGW-Firmicutes-14]